MAGFGRQPFGTSPFGTGTGTAALSGLTATAQPDNSPPQVRIDIVTDQSSLTVYRVAPDGSQTPVRTYDGGPLPITGTPTVLYDSEVPFGVPVYYTAGGTVSDSGTVTLDVPDVWLIHPMVPARSRRVTVAEISERQAAASLSVRYPIGRRFPIIAHDGQRKADTYTLTLRTDAADELPALKALFDDLATLLLNIPPSLGWVDAGTEYVSIDALPRDNPVGYAGSPYREWPLQCVVSARPVGGSQSFNTYAYSRSLYPTYADRKAAHATYGEAFRLT